MSIFETYRKVLWEYALFRGRARREEFWLYILANVLIFVAFVVVGNYVMKELWNGLARAESFDLGWYEYYSDLFGLVGKTYAIATILPTLSISARRLHDTGRSAWWVLLAFVPAVGILTLIVLYSVDGEPGDNRYGPEAERVSPRSNTRPYPESADSAANNFLA